MTSLCGQVGFEHQSIRVFSNLYINQKKNINIIIIILLLLLIYYYYHYLILYYYYYYYNKCMFTCVYKIN